MERGENRRTNQNNGGGESNTTQEEEVTSTPPRKKDQEKATPPESRKLERSTTPKDKGKGKSLHWINMELDQRNKNVNNIQLKNIKFNCGKCCLVMNTILEKAAGPNFLMFFGMTERRFQNRAVFAIKSWLFRDVLGFRQGTSWVSEEAGGTTVPFRRSGAAYNSSTRKMLLTTPPLSGWLCSTRTMGWITHIFFFKRWCCVFPSPSVGSCCFPPSFVGVVPHSHRVVLPYPSSFWVVGVFLPYTFIRSMFVRQKTKNEVRKPERRRVRHHHPRVACRTTPTKEGGKQYPPEGEPNRGTIIFTLSHCSQHVILTEFQIMLLKWRVKISVESTKSKQINWSFLDTNWSTFSWIAFDRVLRWKWNYPWLVQSM